MSQSFYSYASKSRYQPWKECLKEGRSYESCVEILVVSDIYIFAFMLNFKDSMLLK
jgi:hypothetical protein